MCVWEKHCICWDECIWPEAKSWMFSVSLFGCCRFSFTFLIPHVHSPNLFSLILCPNPVSALWLFRVWINTSGTASHKLKLLATPPLPLGAKEMSLDIPSSYSQLEKKSCAVYHFILLNPPWVGSRLLVVGLGVCWCAFLLIPIVFFSKRVSDPHEHLFFWSISPASHSVHLLHRLGKPCITKSHYPLRFHTLPYPGASKLAKSTSWENTAQDPRFPPGWRIRFVATSGESFFE